jgi:hypothetical protein
MAETNRNTEEAERAAALADKTDDPKLKSAWQRLAQGYRSLVRHLDRAEQHAQVRREENERKGLDKTSD